MSAPRSTIEQVRQWAPPDVNVQGPIFQLTGVDVFELVPAHGRSTAVAVANGQVIDGAAGFRAVVAATGDTETIAVVALVLAGWGQGAYLVDTPKRAGNTLSFRFHGGAPKAIDYDATVDLATGEVTTTDPEDTTSADDKVTRALELLEKSKHKTDWTMAIAGLAEQCQTSTRARDALLGAIASHASAEARVEAARAAPACGAAAVDALVAALADPMTTVQMWAATSLGAIGDARARPALEQAARSGDAGVAYAANAALGRLR